MGNYRYFVLTVALVLSSLLMLPGRAEPGAVATPARDPHPPLTASPTPACTPTWQVVTSPNPGPAGNSLTSVAARTGNDIWAVGGYSPGSGTRTLVEHWDGNQWQVISSPNPSGTMNALGGVTAIATDDVWAVGYHSSTWRTLVEHWDGNQWQVIPSPNANGDSNTLRSVAATGANDVWAVGSYASNGFFQTLVEHWDGTNWSILPSPHPGTDGEELRAVAALAANDVWAAGWYSLSGTELPLIIHWDGNAWSQVPSPNPTGSWQTHLYGLAASGPQDVWAAGCAYGCRQTLLEHWDGTQWSIVPSPNPGNYLNYLYGITATAPNVAVAVGYYGDQGQPGATMVLRWDGGQWTHLPSPSPGLALNLFYGLAVVDGTEWAVGAQADCVGCPFETLIARYAMLCPSPTPTTSPTPTRLPLTWTATAPPSSSTPSSTASPLASPTATPCLLTFTDVPPTNPFYLFIRCLACRQIVSGYADGTFQWQNHVTRGQLAKILANAAGLGNTIPSQQQTFADVPAANAFWVFIERLAATGAISGYDCSGPGEPCDPQNRPYFRWAANATRGQIAKIDARAANFSEPIPSTQQTFTDVPPTSVFWAFIERLAGRSIISGYDCGGPGEPCDPQLRKYFRWANSTTRGQMSKIAANTFFPGCEVPATRR